MRRWEVLRPHVEDGVPLVRAARDAGVASRTAQRWLAAFRTGGLTALGRQPRADAGRPRTQGELVEVIHWSAWSTYRSACSTTSRPPPTAPSPSWLASPQTAGRLGRPAGRGRARLRFDRGKQLFANGPATPRRVDGGRDQGGDAPVTRRQGAQPEVERDG